jgi:TrmH family RNA methyltransferase
VTLITAKDNPFVKSLKRLAHDNTAYRQQGQVWLEGDHLCRAADARGLYPKIIVFSESKYALSAHPVSNSATKVIVLSDKLFADISGLESPANLGYLIDLPSPKTVAPAIATVVLDRVQDAGNVGSILRSAAAFGYTQIIALKGTAALWSPKVLRAGMGAHFALSLLESQSPETLDTLTIPLVVTSSHQGHYLHQSPPSFPCALVLGHEGQGVSSALQAKATHALRIAQPGGEESLNVAAAAAICLYGMASM